MLTTRRDFSKWLAGFVGVATVGQVPALAEAGPDWAAMEQELLAALKPLHAADDEIARIDFEIERWRSNHQSEWPDHVKAYEDLLRRLKPGVARQRRSEIYDRYIEICKRIADTPVRNLADIRAKAKLAKYENESGPIHRLLIKQLQSI